MVPFEGYGGFFFKWRLAVSCRGHRAVMEDTDVEDTAANALTRGRGWTSRHPATSRFLATSSVSRSYMSYLLVIHQICYFCIFGCAYVYRVYHPGSNLIKFI